MESTSSENSTQEETKVAQTEQKVEGQIEESKQKVTAFEVVGDETGVDYDKLIKEFGCHKILPE